MKILTTNNFENMNDFIKKHQIEKDFIKTIQFFELANNAKDILKTNKTYKIRDNEYGEKNKVKSVYVFRLNREYRLFYSFLNDKEVLFLDIIKHD
jgi:hypothetical protein